MQLLVLLTEAILILCVASRKSLFSIMFSVFYMILVSMQFSSLIFSGKYIQPLAIENLDELSTVGIKPIVLFIIPIILFSVLLFKLSKNKSIFPIFCGFFLILLSVFTDKTTLRSITQCLYDINESKNLLLTRDNVADSIGNELTKNRVVYDSNIENYLNRGKYNVIVIFAEGFSSKIISDELTPNLSKMINKSISINNYYNHTAATYRGIRGQLTSSFQLTGGSHGNKTGITQVSSKELEDKYGKESKLTSIIEVLNSAGYTTSFQSSNWKYKPLTVLNSQLGFKNLYGLDDKKEPKKWMIDELSDKDSYSLLFENITNQKEPFFYVMYTVGTHIGVDSPDKKYGTGENPYFNVYYNMDYYLGNFLDKFDKSELAKNTIIIFTTDHATYPSPDYLKTFSPESNYFVDKIPLIIYKKGVEPKIINAECKNSLSLAPTILDILGIINIENKFLGLSLFDNKKSERQNYISAISKQFYDTENCEVNLLTSEEDKEKIIKYQLFGG
ncbi:TPA: LTA synthase family protein [Proteus mirabilis]